MRDTLNKFLRDREMLITKERDLESTLKIREEEVINTGDAQVVLQQGAKMSQDHLASHLSTIVTEAIQAVIQKPYEFICEFVERRGATEADLYLVKDGEKYDILEGTGGGLADVCSFSLKVAYLLLSNVDKVLIIDEVSRHINSPVQRERFAQVLQKLSREFDLQIIINTTIPELLTIADHTITLEQVKGETRRIN